MILHEASVNSEAEKVGQVEDQYTHDGVIQRGEDCTFV